MTRRRTARWLERGCARQAAGLLAATAPHRRVERVSSALAPSTLAVAVRMTMQQIDIAARDAAVGQA